MTEKRFTRKEYAIYEKGNPICMTLRDVDKRLNELYEENEQLKKENNYLTVLLASIKGAFEENSILTKSDFEKVVNWND